MKLTPKQYIKENIAKKSIQEIASDLGIKERTVKKILEKEKHKLATTPDEPEVELGKNKWIIIVHIILIITIGLLAYFRSFNNKFAWDDQLLITQNHYVTNFQSSFLPKIFSGPISEGAGERSNAYRPLQILSYVADHSFYVLNPYGFHLTSFLIHLLTSLVFYLMIKMLFRNELLALIAAILFLIHPVQTEAVAYISGRADPLAALLILSTNLFFIKYYKQKRPYFLWLSFASFALALMSKEAAILTPLLLCLCYSTIRKPSALSPKMLFPFSIYGAITAIYVILRLTVLNFDVSDISSPVKINCFHFFKTIFLFAKILLVPLGLHMEYGEITANLSDPSVLLGIGIVIALILTIIKQKKLSAVKFGILWFCINIAAVSNIFPINDYFGEHWVYIASMGYFLVLAALTESIIKQNTVLSKITIVAIALLAIFYSYLTAQQNKVWRDSQSIYEHSLIYDPLNAKLINNLGIIYAEKGLNDKAMEQYKKAIELDRHNVQAYYNMGNMLMNKKKLKEAAEYYLKAVELDPTSSEANYNLGNLYVSIHEYDKAEKQYQRAITLSPYYVQAYNNLAGSYNLTGRKDLAIKEWKAAIKIDPNFEDAKRNLERFDRPTGN